MHDLPSGSLIHGTLPTGETIGGDADGRLRCAEVGMKALGIAERMTGMRVLDIGSNACHFPLLYRKWGAKYVRCLEGRPEFQQFAKTFGFDMEVADMRVYVPTEQYDVVSALGMIYHLADPWRHLRRIYDASGAKCLIVESQIWAYPWLYAEEACDGTMALEDAEIPRLTREGYIAGAEAHGFELCQEISGLTWITQFPIGEDGKSEKTMSTRALWVFQNKQPKKWDILEFAK
jgi:hypothetical protein